MGQVATLLHACVVGALLLSTVSGQEHAHAVGTHRIAFGSCANPNQGGKIWRNILYEHPQHLILLGDVMYADYEAFGKVDANSPGKIHREYAILAADKHLQRLLGTVPVWSATYDDHDYGVNNGDKTFIYRDVGLEAFRKFARTSFSDVQYDQFAKQNGVYSAKLVNAKIGTGANAVDFTYKVILLDSRSNKDRKGTVNGDFLGEEQWAWLSEQFLDPTPDLILLSSSIQVLSDDKFVEESWNEFPEARERLLKLVTAASTLTNVVLLSGDIHRAEVSRATCSLHSTTDSTTVTANTALNATAALWELTSSGLTHTLRQVVDDKATTSGIAYADSSVAAPIPVKSRGWRLGELGDRIYQFAYPGYYRERKDADAFAEVHYALLDIVPNTNSDHAPDSAAVELQLRVISHAQEVVIYKNIPLRSRQSFVREILHSSASGAGAGTAEGNAGVEERVAWLKQALSTPTSDSLQLNCVAYWGATPLWRSIMYRAIIALCMLVLVVLPVLGVLWLVFASVYYICIGKELARRDEIERRYQTMKKQD